MRMMFALAVAVLATGVSARAADVPYIKVMSYNIRYGTPKYGENHWDKRKDFLAKTVKAFDLDLLGTQETLAA